MNKYMMLLEMVVTGEGAATVIIVSPYKSLSFLGKWCCAVITPLLPAHKQH